MKVHRRYWDSDAFLGYLKAEEGKYLQCQAVLEAGARSELELVTSALTIAEVLHLRKGPKLPKEIRAKIDELFEYPFIHVVNVTRSIAILARDLFWDHDIAPKDAIHVATAIYENVPWLETFDKGLLKFDGKLSVQSGEALRVREPGEGLQISLLDS